MLFGKKIILEKDEDKNDIIKEREKYIIPNNLSQEIVSFLNGMLQFIPEKRLSASQLLHYFFLINNNKDFHKINLKEISFQIKGTKLIYIIENNNDNNIWSIFNAADKNVLNNIHGSQFMQPIEEETSKISLNNNHGQNIEFDNKKDDSSEKKFFFFRRHF